MLFENCFFNYRTIMYVNNILNIFCKFIDLNIRDIFIHRNIFLFPQYFTDIRLMCTTSPQYKYTYDQIKISCISKIKIRVMTAAVYFLIFFQELWLFCFCWCCFAFIDFLPADLVSKHYNTYHSKHSVKRPVQ